MRKSAKPNPKRLRVIKTARDERSINLAAREGFRPLVKRLQPLEEIHSEYTVQQSRSTGEIRVFGDFRSLYREPAGDYEEVIGWNDYYPYSFPSPYAAYLIPKHIKVGERVLVEDLIEDFIGMKGGGGVYRLDCCEAVWNGTDLEIQYDPRTNQDYAVG